MPENTQSPDPIGILGGYTPAPHFEPSEEDKVMVQEINTLWSSGYEGRIPYERQWELFRLFLKGEQLLYRDKETGDVVRVIDYDNKRLYSLNNQLRPTARSLVGKLASMIPSFAIIPATGEQAEIHGAQAGDVFFRHLRRVTGFEDIYLELQEDLIWAGLGICFLGWDPTRGRRFAMCPDCDFTEMGRDLVGRECPQCAEQQQQAMQLDQETAQMQMQMGEQPTMGAPPGEIPFLEEVFEGDVCLQRWDPRDVVVEQGVDDPRKLRYLISRVAEPVSEVRRRFPALGSFVRAESGIYSDRSAKNTYSTQTGTWGTDFLEDHVYLFTYIERPTELYPNGRAVYMANDMILMETECLFEEFGRLPVFFQFWQRNPGEFYPESFCQQAWHRQKELNEAETQIREAAELLARTKVIIPRQAHVSADEITATTGQVITFNGAAAPPQYMMPPPIPVALIERRNQLIDDIRIQGAVTEQDMGESASDPNGRAMAIIEAESDRQIGPMLTRNWRELGELHRCALIMAREMYHPDRKVLVAGELGHEVISMEEINLTPGWDVDIEVEDGLSRNQAVRLNQVGQLIQLGVLMDPTTGMPDVTKLAKMAKLKVPGVGPDVMSSEYAAAQNLIRTLETRDFEAAFAMVGPEDDPSVFGQAILNWLRKKGRQMREDDPEVVDMMRQLYMYYTQWAMVGAPGMDAGGDGGGGGPPGAGGGGGQSQEPGESGIAGEAEANVDQADQAAEAQARTQLNQES